MVLNTEVSDKIVRRDLIVIMQSLELTGLVVVVILPIQIENNFNKMILKLLKGLYEKGDLWKLKIQ